MSPEATPGGAGRPTLPVPHSDLPASRDAAVQATLPLLQSVNSAEVPVNVPGYEVVRELGRGGMGVVYLARQSGLHRYVALKMILAGCHADEGDRQRFQTEADAIAHLQHPNIVQIHEIGAHHGLPYFSLEFCSGGSLERQLAIGPLAQTTACAMIEVLARAIQVAHEKGIIHRDLKPANVLFTEHGIPKITDFGLAKKLGEEGKTATGAVMGTPSYMAPEQAEGKKEVGPACDIYALGAILYECLTGTPPFKSTTALETLLQVIAVEPVSPRRVNARIPVDLETVCLKCLRKDPRRRYGSAAELADDLGRFQRGEPICARRTGRTERIVRWCGRNPALALSLGVWTLALLLGCVGLTWWNAKEATSDPETVAPPPQPEKELTDSLGLRLMRIPAGRFLMGAPESERTTTEPVGQRAVEISRDFYLGKYEVTRGQFRQFVENKNYKTASEQAEGLGFYLDLAEGKRVYRKGGNWRDVGFDQSDDHPVVLVTWTDARAFCEWKTQQEGHIYRLPSEAEWEYACRAGTTTRFVSGATSESQRGWANWMDSALVERMPQWAAAYTWGKPVDWKDGYAFTAPVGSFRGNPWGIHDMGGNVWEWCLDYWEPDNQDLPARDPVRRQSATNPAFRCLRGGSFLDIPHWSAHRSLRAQSEYRASTVGFRVVREVAPR